MGLNLPGELAGLLNELGYNWPETDEDKLFQLGGHWLGLGGTLQNHHTDATTHATSVTTDHHGAAIESFKNRWDHPESPAAVLKDGTTAAHVVGGCLYVCAAVVLALKINVIVQLTILLIEIFQAIATAPETFGGSLLEIPVFKKLADMAINFIINTAMEAILG